MDVSAVQVPDNTMTLENYIDYLFSLQQQDLARHFQSKLEVCHL